MLLFLEEQLEIKEVKRTMALIVEQGTAEPVWWSMAKVTCPTCSTVFEVSAYDVPYSVKREEGKPLAAIFRCPTPTCRTKCAVPRPVEMPSA